MSLSLTPSKLSDDIFKVLVKNSVLAAVELCVVFEGQLLVGKRKNRPLRGEWFVPGGCLRKGENWRAGISRVAKQELNYEVNLNDLTLMGLWDHFYDDSAFGATVSTQYITFPHVIFCNDKPLVIHDNQHEDLDWFTIDQVLSEPRFHPYLKNYAKWIADFSN